MGNFWRNFKKINIVQQDLSQIIMRHKYGGAEAAKISGVVIFASATSVGHSYTGSGYFYFVRMGVFAGSNSQNIYPEVVIDGEVIMPARNYATYNGHAYDKNTEPVKLMVYSVSGDCSICWFFNPPLFFSDSVAFQFRNGTGSQRQGVVEYFYTAL